MPLRDEWRVGLPAGARRPWVGASARERTLAALLRKLPLSRRNGALLGSFTCPRLPRRPGRPEVAAAVAGACCASVSCLSH